MYDIIIRCCPELKCLFLDAPSSEWIEDIMTNPRMPNNLTKLKMNKVSIFNNVSFQFYQPSSHKWKGPPIWNWKRVTYCFIYLTNSTSLSEWNLFFSNIIKAMVSSKMLSFLLMWTRLLLIQKLVISLTDVTYHAWSNLAGCLLNISLSISLKSYF